MHINKKKPNFSTFYLQITKLDALRLYEKGKLNNKEQAMKSQDRGIHCFTLSQFKLPHFHWCGILILTAKSQGKS